jgi:hypothetical protein
MLRKLFIGWVVLVLVVVGTAWAVAPWQGTKSSTIYRITDGIGWQYKCVSSSIKNQYGFGGVADTLATDSTVSRGTLMNIKRAKEAQDAGLAEILPIFVSARTSLDSSYIYNKWSAVCWGLNNYLSSIGGLNGWQSVRPDSGRFSPYFARVVRANGIYLAPRSVFPPNLNYGTAVLTTVTGAFTYSDSNAIDSLLYGAGADSGEGDAYAHPGNVHCTVSGTSGAGTCTVKVFGANQNLIHGRTWQVYLSAIGDGEITLAPNVAADSCYNIDSAKVTAYTGTAAGLFRFRNTLERRDSL